MGMLNAMKEKFMKRVWAAAICAALVTAPYMPASAAVQQVGPNFFNAGM